jgi:hypothetical protein
MNNFVGITGSERVETINTEICPATPHALLEPLSAQPGSTSLCCYARSTGIGTTALTVTSFHVSAKRSVMDRDLRLSYNSRLLSSEM